MLLRIGFKAVRDINLHFAPLVLVADYALNSCVNHNISLLLFVLNGEQKAKRCGEML